MQKKKGRPKIEAERLTLNLRKSAAVALRKFAMARDGNLSHAASVLIERATKGAVRL